MCSCDDIYQWFCDKYKKSKSKNSIVYLSDIYDVFKTSTYFDNLSKADKRKFNKKHFETKVEKNNFSKKYYKMREDRVDGYQLKKDAIIGWELISDEYMEMSG